MAKTAGGGQSDVDADPPWSKSFDAPAGTPLLLTAQAKTGDGALTCTIAVDGKTVETKTVLGSGSVATCAGEAR
jgi:hypothetical protein